MKVKCKVREGFNQSSNVNEQNHFLSKVNVRVLISKLNLLMGLSKREDAPVLEKIMEIHVDVPGC